MSNFKIFILSFSFIFLSGDIQAQEIFIKISNPAIEGESQVIGHENEISALRYAQETSACDINSGGPGSGVCKVITSSFAFDLEINKSIIGLKSALYRATHIERVEITFRKPGNNPYKYYQIILGNVVVSKLTDATDGSTNVCQVQFSAEKFFWTYFPQTGTGASGTPITFGWNSKTNTAWDGM